MFLNHTHTHNTRNMLNKNGQLPRKKQPLGICQRLFSFIMSGLVSRGVKPMILETPRDNQAEIIVEDVRNNKRVSFKELENWTPVHNLRSSEKEVPLIGDDHQDRLIERRKETKKKSYYMAPNDRLVILETEHDDDSAPKLRPFFSVESNINEKSSEFIQRRKEAMLRNVDP